MAENDQAAARDVQWSVRVPQSLADQVEQHRQARQKETGLRLSRADAVVEVLAAGLEQLGEK
jgi:hypothetical protein